MQELSRFRIQLIKSYRTETFLNEKDLALSSLEDNLDILTNELPIKVLINNKDQIFSDEEVLHDVNFNINKGEKIAIVGENGSGKSTLIKLLMRFYDPSKG